MAVRKLPSSLFFPKARISPSTRYPHLLEKRNGRNLYVFICSAQPGLTVTSFGTPKRCPLCSQRYPIGRDNQA
jgi:rubrerythrin